MRKTLLGTAFAAFAIAPAMAWADCDFHNKASMASSAPAQKSDVQAQASGKASAPVVAKTSTAKHVKPTSDKPAPTPSKSDASTVVAKTN